MKTVAIAKIALIALATAATPSASEAADDTDPHNRRDIQGGTQVTARHAPFLVFLETRFGTYRSECLGTLISDLWILTAAHCVQNSNNRIITVRHLSGRSRQHIARTFIQADPRRHIAIYLHPLYKYCEDCTWSEAQFDIALLKLVTPIPHSSAIPARLPTEAEALTIRPGLTVRTIGHTGRRSAAEVRWQITTQPLPSIYQIHTFFSATRTEPGDSGGPMIINAGNQAVLIGITFGNNAYSSIAVSTAYHASWIHSIDTNLNEPPRPTPPPATITPRASGNLSLILKTNQLKNITCKATTSDGATLDRINYDASASFNWSLSSPFRITLTIDCR